MGKLKEFFFRFFRIKSFSRIVLRKEVLDDIAEFAKKKSPKEFVALLSGNVRGDALIIDKLTYQPFDSSSKTAYITFITPNIKDLVGSVHSHPGKNIKPSDADIAFFGKNGNVHFIIGYPYSKERIACYDSYGNELKFAVE